LRESHRRGLAIYNATNTGGGQGRRMELTAMRADGSEFPVELAISRILIDGKPMFTAYLRDITERQQAERITSELAAVVAHSNDAIVGLARSKAKSSAERRCGADLRLCRRGSDRAPARHSHSAGPARRISAGADHGAARRQLANYETFRLRKDGRRISVSLTESPIRSERGRVSGLSSIARDITERKTARGRTAPVAEDGRGGAAGWRHRARFQQHSHGDPRLQRSAHRPDR